MAETSFDAVAGSVNSNINLIKTKTISISTNQNGVAILSTSDLNPNTQIPIFTYEPTGWNASISQYLGEYKVKLWDSAGATFQVNANSTKTIHIYYIERMI